MYTNSSLFSPGHPGPSGWRARRQAASPRSHGTRCRCDQCRPQDCGCHQCRHEQSELGDWLRAPADAAGRAARGLASLLAPQIHDRTGVSNQTHRKRTRDVRSVDSLVLHQMAFSRGSDPNRYNNTNSHFIILPDGGIHQLHPESALLWASNGFNNRSVAVELAGNLPDVRGRCWEASKYGCHRLTDAQVHAGRALVLHLKRKIGISHVFAHRQASGTRDNDPGPDAWYHIGQWAVETQGLSDGGPGYRIGSGSPILPAWRTWGRPGQPGHRQLGSGPAASAGSGPQPEVGELTLWRGLRGPEVADLQQRLNQRGGYGLAVDGQFGPATDAAVRAFQGSNGLAADGIVGPLTWAALTGTGRPPAYAPPSGGPAGPPLAPPTTNWSAVRASIGDTEDVGGGIRVNRVIAGQVRALLAAAARDGVPLRGKAFRTRDEQIALRREHCGTSQFDIFEKPSSACATPTAIPGTSRHEQGLAIDFALPLSGAAAVTTAEYKWLAANAARFGLKQLPSEAWHWSVDGR